MAIQILDVNWGEVPRPDARDLSPSFALPLGGAWKPNDWRFVCVAGMLRHSVVYYPTGISSESSPMPNPAGWSTIASDVDGSGRPVPVVIGRRLQAGDTDGEFSLKIPASSGFMANRGNYFAWSTSDAFTLGKPATLAFTVRGIDPSYTPVGYRASTSSSAYGSAPTYHTVTYSARTLAAGAVPGYELLIVGNPLDSMPKPSGWADVWNSGFSGDDAVRPSKAAATQVIWYRKYTSSGSTGTTTVVDEVDGTPPSGLTVTASGGNENGLTSSASATALGATPCFIYFKMAQDVTVSGTAAPQETDSAFSATVSNGPDTTVHATAAPMETDQAYGGCTPLSGFTVQDPWILPGTPVIWSKMRWREVFVPPGGTITVETSLDWGETWQAATNGGPIVGLRPGNTTVNAVLVRVTFTRAAETDPTPRIANLEPLIACDSGWDELHPLGTFLIRDTDVELAPDNTSSDAGGGSTAGVAGHGGGQKGGARSILVKAVDLSWAITENPWQEPYYIAAGTSYEEAGMAMVKDRLPGQTKFNIATTGRVTPTLIFGAAPNSDAWKDIKELFLAVGFDAYFAPDGTFTALPVPDPAVGVPVFEISGADGPVPVISAAKKKLSSREYRNWIIIDGEAVSPVTGQEIVAVHAEARDEEAIARFGPRSRQFTLQAVTDGEQGQLAADALLVKLNGTNEVLEATIPPNCTLEPGDIGTVHLPDLNATGNYVIQAMDTPFSQAKGQRLALWRLTHNDEN